MVLMLLGPLCGWWGAPAPVGAQTLDADVQALLAFKAGGDADGDLSSWDPAAGSPCGVGWNDYSSGWDGVRCDAEGGRVTRVYLYYKRGVSGTLASLAACTGLTYIDLRSTAVTGTLGILAGCTGLTYIDLGGTAVTGSVESLAAITGLTHINLGRTAVTGSVDSLATCTGLTYIRLDQTAVTGSVESLAAITGLTYIQLGGTQSSPSAVTGSVDSLAACTGLTTIALQSSAVTGSVDSLAACTGLTTINLYQTAVSGSVESLAACTGLTYISLFSTAVTGSVESLAACTGLTIINLMNTAVSGNVESLATCTDLNSLSLANTFVSGDAAILRSSVTGLSDWADFTACSAWSGTCAAGSLVERPSEHAGRTVSACCDAFCAGNAVGPDFDGCNGTLPLRPDATSARGYDTASCCACPLGQRQAEAGCELCPAGFSTEFPGAPVCTQCESGKEAPAAGDTCEPCLDGFMSDVNSTTSTITCAACPHSRRCVQGQCVIGATGSGCATCDIACTRDGCKAERYFQRNNC
jgi:hypothetical protein